METEVRRLFPSARTCTVVNGTDPIPSPLQQPRPRDISDKTIVFSCGSFYERKGFPLLIEAYSRVAGKYPESQLRIAGDGAERADIESRISYHGLQNQVILLGKLTHEDVLREMIWSDAFALLGWDEPFATVFSEAASAGKPIVCCTDGGFCDVLQNEVHGLSVPPRDVDKAARALDLILGNEDRRLEMGRAARSLFEARLKWDHNAEEMIQIFQTAVARCCAV
jgi:glycosyltransferase involved in cell wall biosynthesis